MFDPIFLHTKYLLQKVEDFFQYQVNAAGSQLKLLSLDDRIPYFFEQISSQEQSAEQGLFSHLRQSIPSIYTKVLEIEFQQILNDNDQLSELMLFIDDNKQRIAVSNRQSSQALVSDNVLSSVHHHLLNSPLYFSYHANHIAQIEPRQIATT